MLLVPHFHSTAGIAGSHIIRLHTMPLVDMTLITTSAKEAVFGNINDLVGAASFGG